MIPSTVLKFTELDLKKMFTDYLRKTNQELGKVDIDIKSDYVGYYETKVTKVVVLVTKNSNVNGHPIETVDTYEESDIKEIIRYMLQDSEYKINSIIISAHAASQDGPFSSPEGLDSISVNCTKKEMEKVMK